MKRILSLFVLNLFFISGLWAQQTSVTVPFTDESGLPLPGATIIVENSNRGVTTDFDGNFTINAQAGEVLIVSYVGYQDNRVTVGNETSYTISLQADTALEEVIVMGYGSQNKSEITGSAKQVNSDEISQFPITSPDQVLQGKVAGLSLSSPSGIPGTVQNILIRGRSSITASNAPLFVIDGIPVESGGLQRSTARSTLTPLATLSPEDIESITVLKDPSSTAPYGARGTNGVIVITTKKGKSGKTTLNFSSTYGFQNDAIEGPEMLTGAEREMLFYESLYNSYGASEGFSRDQAGEFYRNNPRRFGSNYTTWNENGRQETRWADYITNKDAPLQTYDFSARGGNEKSNFSISSGYVKQEATVIGSTFERFTGGISLQTELLPDLTFSTRNTFGYVEQDAVLEQSAYFASARAVKFFSPPITSPYNEDGSYNINLIGSNYNPLYLAENDIAQNKVLRIINNNNIVWNTPLENLTFKSTFGVDLQQIRLKAYSNRNHGGSVEEGGTAWVADFSRSIYTFQNSLNYRYSPADAHSFDFTILQEFQKGRINSLSADGESFAADGLTNLNNAGTPTGANSAYNDWSIGSYLALLNYSYQSKYLFNSSYRREGNSRFPKAGRWGDFWSVGVGWNMHREPFMDNVNFVDNLKLRTSFGVTGNAGIGLNTYQSALAFDTDYGGQAAIYPSRFGNKNLQWETAASFEAGLDFGLFGNQISGAFNYYSRETKDMLQNVPLSRTTGFSSQNQNVGRMVNKGIEIELSTQIIQNEDFTFSIDTNIGTNKNEVLELAKDGNREEINITTSTRRVASGHTVYEWYMRDYAGVNPDNGNAWYWTDETRTAKTENFNEAERFFMGKGAVPTLLAGLVLNLQYKGFFLNAQLNYVGGHKVWEEWTRYTNGSNRISLQYYNGINKLLDRWQQPGDVTDVPKVTYTYPPWQTHSRFLYDGDYARLRDFSFGYNFRNELARSIVAEQIRLFVRGVNLYTWVKDKNLVFDPEVESDGFVQLTNPPTKNIILGINVNF